MPLRRPTPSSQNWRQRMSKSRMSMAESAYPANPCSSLGALNATIGEIAESPTNSAMVDTRAIKSALSPEQYSLTMKALALASFATALHAGGYALAAVDRSPEATDAK